jgi:hypothetical protein
MTTSTFSQTNFSSQSGATYFPTLDGDVRVMSRVAAAFAPHDHTRLKRPAKNLN